MRAPAWVRYRNLNLLFLRKEEAEMQSTGRGKRIQHFFIFIVTTLFLIAAGAAAAARAQQPNGPPGGEGQQTMPGQQPMPGEPGSGMPGQQQMQPKASVVDQAFLRKTLEDSVVQVQMGNLAAQKSSSDDVKQFGQKMAEIHTQLKTQLKPVAEKLGVDEPKAPSKRDKQEIERMEALSGQDFDAAFLKAMLHDQQTDLKDFKEEAQSSQDPAVQQVAKMDTPVLSQHLQILEQLAQEHNVEPATKESDKSGK
jgi:putative membrane protein